MTREPNLGLYCAGWLATGPRGVIIDTMNEAYKTGQTILHDWNSQDIQNREKPGFSKVDSLLVGQGDPRSRLWRLWDLFFSLQVQRWLFERGVRPVSFDHWEQIDQAEKELGQVSGKPREKFIDIKRMVQILICSNHRSWDDLPFFTKSSTSTSLQLHKTYLHQIFASICGFNKNINKKRMKVAFFESGTKSTFFLSLIISSWININGSFIILNYYKNDEAFLNTKPMQLLLQQLNLMKKYTQKFAFSPRVLCDLHCCTGRAQKKPKKTPAKRDHSDIHPLRCLMHKMSSAKWFHLTTMR